MGLTVKGVPMNASQQAYADQIVAAGNALKAGSIATAAVIVEAIAESGLGEAMGWDSQNPTYGGLLAGNIGTFGGLGGASSAAVTAAEIHAAFVGGQGYVAGGAIGLARSQSDPLQIAMTNSGSGTQFLGEAGVGNFAAEAHAIIAAGGGATIKGGIAGHGGTGTITNASASTTYPFQIGSTSNPDEDLWTGCNRIAQEVNWYFFTNGEALYYMDGQEMIAQEPAFYLDRINDAGRFASPVSGTWDNTAFSFVSTHKRKFRIQRKTKLTQITSPTQVTLDLICGIDEIRGGDVGVLTSFGLMDGRWLVADCTRSVFGVSSRITLVPPIAPITEAAVAGTTGKSAPNSANVAPGAGKLTGPLRDKVVQVAKAAIAREASSGAYSYAEVRPYPASLFGAAPVPAIDCSSFSILCYKDAGAPDPNGTGFDGNGNTQSLIARGTAVSTPSPGDLVFYSPPGVGTNGHVAVYLGNDQIANMGAPNAGEPKVESLNIYPISAVRSYL